jgi:hypothetical protein
LSNKINVPYFIRLKIVLNQFDETLAFCSDHVRDCSIVIDDCQACFSSTLTNIQQQFLITPKNNRYDVFVQYHTTRKTPIGILEGLDMLILKQTQDNEKSLERLPEPEVVKLAYEQIKAENLTNKNRYAYRVLNYQESQLENFEEEIDPVDFYDFTEGHKIAMKLKQDRLKRVNKPRNNYY